MRELIIPIGLPGSGKTTLINDRYKKTHTILSLDNIRLAMGCEYNPKIESYVRAHFEISVISQMIGGAKICFDSTNTSKYIIEKWLGEAYIYGYSVKIIIFNIPVDICKERQIHNCPLKIFERFHNQMEETLKWIRNDNTSNNQHISEIEWIGKNV